MTIEDFPVAPLVFETGTGDDEAEWWRIARDCYERLGWGFTKSAHTANAAAEAIGVKFSRTGPTVSSRAKRQEWTKGTLYARTDDERQAQTAAAQTERHRMWAERRIEMANYQGEIAFAAADELHTYFQTPQADRVFIKSKTSTEHSESASYEDGSARAQRTATIMGIAIDKADKLLADLDTNTNTGHDTETRQDKLDRLAPLFNKITERLDDKTG